jgi:hypothetical protein
MSIEGLFGDYLSASVAPVGHPAKDRFGHIVRVLHCRANATNPEYAILQGRQLIYWLFLAAKASRSTNSGTQSWKVICC